jgi:hypothetical protein
MIACSWLRSCKTPMLFFAATSSEAALIACDRGWVLAVALHKQSHTGEQATPAFDCVMSMAEPEPASASKKPRSIAGLFDCLRRLCFSLVLGPSHWNAGGWFGLKHCPMAASTAVVQVLRKAMAEWGTEA